MFCKIKYIVFKIKILFYCFVVHLDITRYFHSLKSILDDLFKEYIVPVVFINKIYAANSLLFQLVAFKMYAIPKSLMLQLVAMDIYWKQSLKST